MTNREARDWSRMATHPDARVPYHALLGLEPLAIHDGSCRIRLVVRPEHLRSGTIVHGGLLASLLDSALGLAAATQAPEAHDLVTIQLNLNFVRPARVGDILHATGEVLHYGRRTALSRGEVRNASNSLVATATATLMFLPNVMAPERSPEGQGAPTGPRDMGATGEGP